MAKNKSKKAKPKLKKTAAKKSGKTNGVHALPKPSTKARRSTACASSI